MRKLHPRYLFPWLAKQIFNVNIIGRGTLTDMPGALVVANHSSYLDVFLIGLALSDKLDEVCWVISKENYRIWYLKWFYALYNVIVVNGTVEKAKHALQEKKWVVIFPEGARRWCSGDKTLPAKLGTGAAALALSTGVPLLPIAISGANKALGTRSLRLDRRQQITVHVGKPFAFPDIRHSPLTPELLAETTRDIFRHIAELLPQEEILKTFEQAQKKNLASA